MTPSRPSFATKSTTASLHSWSISRRSNLRGGRLSSLRSAWGSSSARSSARARSLALVQTVGDQSGKVIVDFKTGNPSPDHRDDLWFYALLNAIRIGTPPPMIASYYLHRGEFSPQAVTDGVLEATIARISDAIWRIVAVRFGGAEASTQTGPGCRWCPKLETSESGTAFVSLDDELSDNY